MTLSRRQLTQQLLGGFALAAILPERRVLGRLIETMTRLEPPAEGATLLGTVPMRGTGRGRVDRMRGSGLACRLPQDLSKLTEDTLITSNDAHFIRTGCPANINLDEPWEVRLESLDGSSVQVTPVAIDAAAASDGPLLMECSGNPRSYGFGLMSVADWSGVKVVDLLDEHLPDWRGGAENARVLISGFDDHVGRSGNSTEGASWIFTDEQLRDAGAMLVTRMNGEPLPRDHGFPVRLIVPGWYGCTCIKWVNEVRIVGDDARATSQMREFASRTHQRGVPRVARDYRPAEMDLSAMPVRIERWEVNSAIEYRVVGIIWGGAQTTDKLMIRFNDDEPWQHVSSLDHRTNRTWTLWTHTWRPEKVGRFSIRLKVDDPSIRTRRLDSGFYRRTVDIARV